VSKAAVYQALVAKRKEFKFSHKELSNPVATAFDEHGQLEPWAQWQGNLDARVVVVGQEFCDVETYIRTEGKVERFPNVYEYPSNKNLHDLCGLLGFDVGHPTSPNKSAPFFFTNAVMALKAGSMSANFHDRWLEESRREFLAPLLDIIRPKVIISIGAKATLTVGRHFGFKVGKHSEMLATSPIQTKLGPLVFPVYHTGGLGLRNRSKALQEEDWKRIKDYI